MLSDGRRHDNNSSAPPRNGPNQAKRCFLYMAGILICRRVDWARNMLWVYQARLIGLPLPDST